MTAEHYESMACTVSRALGLGWEQIPIAKEHPTQAAQLLLTASPRLV